MTIEVFTRGEVADKLIAYLGVMADAVVNNKAGQGGKFYTRDKADEIALLLREAERFVMEAR